MDWFTSVTGFTELGYTETQARLQVVDGRLINEAGGFAHAVGELELVSLAELRARATAARVPGQLTLDVIESGIGRLHRVPENANAVFQVASQFNLLEMVDPDVTPEHGVTRYEYDPTQGPACAIAAGAGTIWRNYLVPVGDGIGQTAGRQLDGLADLGVSLAQALGMGTTPLWQMRNGYALPDADGLARIHTHLSGLTESERDALRGRLRLGLHRDVGVTHPEALPDTRVTQIYCSALPIAYSTIPGRQWAGFASLVLEAAYEATLLAGILNAARGASRRVFMTRLGGGAFGNDATWIDSAIIRALRLCAHQGLEVFLVSRPGSSTGARAVEAAWRMR